MQCALCVCVCVGVEGISAEKKGISFQLRSLLHENKVGASTMKGRAVEEGTRRGPQKK